MKADSLNASPLATELGYQASMVCILCHAIGPYHAARYRALSRIWPAAQLIELATEQRGNPWINMAASAGLSVRRLFDRPLKNISASDQATLVVKTLEELNPAIVVSVGYSERCMRAAARWARKHGKASVMITATWSGDKTRYLPLEQLKGSWCRKYYDAIIVPGQLSFNYFAGLGYPLGNIWRGLDVVDNEYFIEETTLLRNGERQFPSSMKLPEKYFLCCARLAPEKNLSSLIQAFQLYRGAGGRFELVIVGGGPLEDQLRSLLGTNSSLPVHLLGWRHYTELPFFYARASCVILPSISEPWGLVINEAMASGLPVLVSNKCGCAPELCWRGINGYDFNPYNTREIAALMLRISSGDISITDMGNAGRDIVASFTPATCAAVLAACFRSLLN